MKKKLISFLLTCTMLFGMVPAQSLTAVEPVGGEAAGKETKEVSYSFSSDSLIAAEYEGVPRDVQVEVTRGGDLSKASEMNLVTYDLSAEYGDDYVISYDGNKLEKCDGTISMYAAFRDHPLVGDYEENSDAFLQSVLSCYNLSAEDGELVAQKPEDRMDLTDEDIRQGLTDADSEGIESYTALATLQDIGARACETTVSFAPGEEKKEITITILPDEAVEYGETFTLALISKTVDEALGKNQPGVPDIPLKKGRDIAAVSATIQNAGDEEPACVVKAVKKQCQIPEGQDSAEADFVRSGSIDTFSTVMLYKDGEAYGYFHFVPYQTRQVAKLEAGTYEVSAHSGCTLSGSSQLVVKGGSGAAQMKKSAEAGSGKTDEAANNGADDISYAPVPSVRSSDRLTTKASAMDWFPDWAKTDGRNEYSDVNGSYISYAKNGTCLFKGGGKSGNGSFSYIGDRDKEKSGVNVYNTIRLDTSGSCSLTKTSYMYGDLITDSNDNNVKNVIGDGRIDFTGIESVETKLYADEGPYQAVIGVHNVASQQQEYEDEPGTHDISVSIPEKCQAKEYVYFQNIDFSSKNDGVEVFFVNGFRLKKRTYQIKVENPEALQYVTESGGTEGVAAQLVGEDIYAYLTYGDNSYISLNTSQNDKYPMTLTGYQLLNKDNIVVENSMVSTTSADVKFDYDFLKKHEQSAAYDAKRDNLSAYETFSIQPIMSKIPVKQFDIVNNDEQSATAAHPYVGTLKLDNRDKDLYQGDCVTLSATTKEGYKLNGAFVRYRKTETDSWETVTHHVDSDGKVRFRLASGYSYYEVEPVFSGSAADTIVLDYHNEEAAKHGSIQTEAADNASTGGYTVISSEEYKINSYVPIIAQPEDGYVTCWHSGNRTYYGNVFYYQMDGNPEHNLITVDFVPEEQLNMSAKDMTVTLLENEVNLRNSSAFAGQHPLPDMNYTITTGQAYQGSTDKNGSAVLKGFKGVIGGIYSMMLYSGKQNSYKYVEFVYGGSSSADITVPAFSGLAAYPDRVTARINGTQEGQEYLDLPANGNVEVTVIVNRPDAKTRIDSVDLRFCYEGDDGEAHQDYTITDPQPSTQDDLTLGNYETYSLVVPASEIPNMSYLYVDVKSSFESVSSGEGQTGTITVNSDTGYVNTGYKCKTPNENFDLSIKEDVPYVPGMTDMDVDTSDISVPFIGILDFGVNVTNGAYFARQNDPNTGTTYLVAGYNVTNTWVKSYTDRKDSAKKTRDELLEAEKESRPKGDPSEIKSNSIVSGSKKPVFYVAPTIALKLAKRDSYFVAADFIFGFDERIILNMPFSVYGVPVYVNLTFNGEQFFEATTANDEGLTDEELNSIYTTNLSNDNDIFIQLPNMDLKVKTGVGYNAFAGVYLYLQGNLKMNILAGDEMDDVWRAGGYFTLTGGAGADLAIFTAEVSLSLPPAGHNGFGDETARAELHDGTLSGVQGDSNAAKIAGTQAGGPYGAGISSMVASTQEQIDEFDRNPTFTILRSSHGGNALSKRVQDGSKPDPNEFLKSASRNADIQIVKLKDGRLMALTLADNGAKIGSCNFLEAVYAVSSDGGKTWENADVVSESSNLQWNVQSYLLDDKLLVTWSEGDMDAAIQKGGASADSGSGFRIRTVARAMNSLDLKGRFFDLSGNAMGESFTIAEDAGTAISSLDAVETPGGGAKVYYECRSYNEAAASLSELITSEQTICKQEIGSDGKAAGSPQQYFIGSDKNGTLQRVKKNSGTALHRITELRAFSHKGITGEIVVLDMDGKLLRDGEDGEKEASMDDRQIYVHVESDSNGIIPAGTILPLSESDISAQHIVLKDDGTHLNLFWNQDGEIMAFSDFLPATASQYAEWQERAEEGEDLGGTSIVAADETLTLDTKFKIASNEKGKNVVLWKDANHWYDQDGEDDEEEQGSQIYAAFYTATESTVQDTDGKYYTVYDYAGTGSPVALTEYATAINNLDAQVLEDGTVFFGYTKLDGGSLGESKEADVMMDTVEESCDLEIARANGEEYPIAGMTYDSYVTLGNYGSGKFDAKDVVVTASGALNGEAKLEDLLNDPNFTDSNPEIHKDGLEPGDQVCLTLPVTAASEIKDGDSVTYTVAQGGQTIAAYEDQVKVGAHMVPVEMASIINVPGTANYQTTVNVRNDGNAEGTPEATYYVYTKSNEEEEMLTYHVQDDTVLEPGGIVELTYLMEDAAYDGDGLRMVDVVTSAEKDYDHDQVVQGELPKTVAKPESEPVVPGPVEPTPSPVEKGDIVTKGWGSAHAKYQVTSSDTVMYCQPAFSPKSKMFSAKVLDSIKIDGKTYRVTAIKAKAFKGYGNLRKVTVGKYVTEIKKQAFENCGKLKTVKLGVNVAVIESEAFTGCKSLSTLTFNTRKLKSIGAKAFNGCKKLTSFTLKSTKLSKKKVKQSLKGSSLKTIRTTKPLMKKYETYFAEENSGRKVAIKKAR